MGKSMWRYQSRVEADLARWQARGWVTEAGSKAIRADLSGRSIGFGLVGALAVLAAVLIGFAAMTFVAANWQELGRAMRLAVLIGGLWASYVAAGALFVRKLDVFAHAAVLAGVALFGASIMLIAQMYHISGNPSDAVLLWAAGGVVAGLAFRSNPALVAAMILVGLWSGWETVQLNQVHWPFLIGWAVVSACFAWQRWRPGFHLAAIALSIWIVNFTDFAPFLRQHWIVIMIGVAVLAAGLAARMIWREHQRTADAVMAYALAVAVWGLLGAQLLMMEAELAKFVGLAAVALALLVGAITFGWFIGHLGVLWVAYVGFSLELLLLYFRTLGTLLNTSLFFAVAGILVLGLALIAYRLGRSPIGGAR